MARKEVADGQQGLSAQTLTRPPGESVANINSDSNHHPHSFRIAVFLVLRLLHLHQPLEYPPRIGAPIKLKRQLLPTAMSSDKSN
jgi:hypothetical protein